MTGAAALRLMAPLQVGAQAQAAQQASMWINIRNMQGK